jgi:hypothetical protein
MEQCIRILWLRDRYPLMQYDVQCSDDEAAWRVFHRLCGILRALVNAEARQQAKEG